MKTVAEVIGVSRANLIERLQKRPKPRIDRPPLPNEEFATEINAVIVQLLTYGCRRIRAILKRQALALGRKSPNHKRVCRVMKVHGRQAGGVERRHDGRIAVDLNAIGVGSPTASRSAAVMQRGAGRARARLR